MVANLTKRLKQNQRGTAAVEFAIVAPLLLTMLAGMAQFGMGYFVRNHMQDVARETSRQVAIGDLNETQAETFASNNLLNLGINYSVDVTPPNPADPTDVNVTTQISAPLADVAPFDFLGMFQSGTVQVAVSMRTE